jgi:glycosyltransferase involved in cell wall biosynthesis
MKLISFAVPCYNSQDYMGKCIDSLLVAGDDAEIIIVNDGSKDGTIDIARKYEKEYPSIVRVVDKENGGHGSGVNKGLELATGLYYKVVDSDDWLDGEALKKLIAKIKEHLAAGTSPDLYITNFIYDKPSVNKQHISDYVTKFKEGEITSWDKVKAFHFSHVMMMHALLYKRQNLLDSGTVLPEHTFYVDNIFAYKPLPFMHTVCYLNLNLYHYFIGRSDQSVNIKNMLNRYEQQFRVMRGMVDAYSWADLKAMPKGLRKYMWHDLQVISMNTIFFCAGAPKTKERKQALKEFWQYVKQRDKKLYRKMRSCSYATVVNYMTWGFRKWIMNVGYNILCKRIMLG